MSKKSERRSEKISFKLSPKPDSSGEHLIYIMVNWGYSETINGKKRYFPLRYSTGEKINPKKWDGHPRYRTKGFPDINTNLQNFENDAYDVIDRLRGEKKLTNDNFRAELDKINKPEHQQPAFTLNSYIDRYVKEIESGERLNKKKVLFSLGSVKQFKTFQKIFNEFQKHSKKTYDFGDIDLGFHDRYTGFLTAVAVTSKGKAIKTKYAPNTVGNHVKRLISIMRAARRENLHSNTFIDHEDFNILREDSEQVYLNDAEVRKLFDLDLSRDKRLELIRDVFLVGCYTLQRYGDYSKIRDANINGNYIKLTQGKTKTKVVVPIKPELMTILKRYNNNLPYTYEQELNKKIKLIARIAGIDHPVELTRTVGGVKKKISYGKYELITSHTARRSGCTNLHLAEVPSIDIMKISGHATEREFLKYIRIDAEGVAQKVSTHPWFQQEYSPLKVAR